MWKLLASMSRWEPGLAALSQATTNFPFGRLKAMAGFWSYSSGKAFKSTVGPLEAPLFVKVPAWMLDWVAENLRV